MTPKHAPHDWGVITLTEAGANILNMELALFATDIAVSGAWVIAEEEDGDGNKVVNAYPSELVLSIAWPRKTSFGQVTGGAK